MLKTMSGKISSEEFKQILEVIKLYSTGKSLKAKSGIPKTHYVSNLSDKSNGKWKQYLEEE